MILASIVYYGILDPSSGRLSCTDAVHHSTIAMTLDTYSLVLPGMGDAAAGDGRRPQENPGCSNWAPATKWELSGLLMICR
jgi:hypothetical protein